MDNRERRSAKKRFTKKRFTVAAILVTAMLLAACTDRNVSKTEETQPPVLTENSPRVGRPNPVPFRTAMRKC